MKKLSSYIADATKPACTIDLNSFEEIHHPLTDFDLKLTGIDADLSYAQTMSDTLTATQSYLNELKLAEGTLDPTQGMVIASLVNQVHAVHGEEESCSMEGVTENALDVSMEAISDAVTKVWETIKRVLAAAIKQVKKFFGIGKNKLEAKEDTTEKLLSRISNLDGTPKEKNVSFSGIGNLSVNGERCTLRDLDILLNVLKLTIDNIPKVAGVYKDFDKIASKITSENLADYRTDIMSTIGTLEEFLHAAAGFQAISSKTVGPRGPGFVGQYMSETFPGERQIHMRLTGGGTNLQWNLMYSAERPPETFPALSGDRLAVFGDRIEKFNTDYAKLLDHMQLISDTGVVMTTTLTKSIQAMQGSVDDEILNSLKYLFSSVYATLKGIQFYANVADKAGGALFNYVVASAKNLG